MFPRKILKIETVKYPFFKVLVNDSAHLLQEKIGQKYRQSFFVFRGKRQDNEMPLYIQIFLFGKPPATDGYMKKGQKTLKNLEFRVKNKENRQKRV